MGVEERLLRWFSHIVKRNEVKVLEKVWQGELRKLVDYTKD